MKRLVRVERRTCWEENGVCIELESDLFLIEMAADREGAWCYYSDTCTGSRYYKAARGSKTYSGSSFFCSKLCLKKLSTSASRIDFKLCMITLLR